MKAVFTLFLFGVISLFSLKAKAQIEIPRTTNSGGVLKAEPEKSSAFPLLRREETNDKDSKWLRDDEPKKIDFREKNDDLKTAGDVAKEKLDKDREAREAYGENQSLGEIKTGGKFVELYSRDHEYVDGDKVQIYVNGVKVQRVNLTAGYTPVLAKLQSGINTIEFEALNQGESGPNTAELKVLDDEGNLVASKEWNLLTGAKATLLVIKE